MSWLHKRIWLFLAATSIGRALNLQHFSKENCTERFKITTTIIKLKLRNFICLNQNFSLTRNRGRGREMIYLLNTEINRNLSILLMFILQQIFQLQVLEGEKVVTTPLSIPSPITGWYCDQSSSTWIHANFFINLLWAQIREKSNQIKYQTKIVYYIEPNSDSYQIGGMKLGSWKQ